MKILKVGDKVRRTGCDNNGVKVGDVGIVTGVFPDGGITLDIGNTLQGVHSSMYLELVEEAKVFDMKKEAWIIEVGHLDSVSKRAVKNWICAQYDFTERDLVSRSDVEYYTNWVSSGVQDGPMYGRSIATSDLHARTKKACKQILLNLKTEASVESVTWPEAEVETPVQKEIKEIMSEIDKLSLAMGTLKDRLKKLEDK
jgi:hypothetical protein